MCTEIVIRVPHNAERTCSAKKQSTCIVQKEMVKFCATCVGEIVTLLQYHDLVEEMNTYRSTSVAYIDLAW